MREWLARIVDWFRRDKLDAELVEELRFHHQQLERDQRGAGTPTDDATWAARRQLGNTTRVRELARERWSLPWLDHLQQDLRYAIRGLRRSRAFTASVILTLGLGIGANAAIFSVIDRLLFRPPPLLVDPGRVNHVYTSYPAPDASGESFVLEAVSYSRYVDLQRWTTSFDRAAPFSYGRLAVGVGLDARVLPVGVVGASFFAFFDAAPVLGRYFTAQEDRAPNGVPVVVLSYASWQSRYGGRSDVIGETIQIGASVYTVIGVASRAFVGLWPEEPPVAFIPISAWAATTETKPRGENWWTSTTWNIAEVLVRRRPGVTTEAASSDLTAALLRSWDAEGAPGPRSPFRPHAIAASVLAERGPNQTSTAKVAALVGGMALIVLLIAAANVANLLLARALRRRREIAVRLAIGVSRARLLSQLMSESVLLSLLGGLAGLAIAQWGGSALRAVFLPPNVDSPVLGDTRTLVFVAIAVGVVGIVTGIAPALQAGGVDLTRYLKTGVHEGTTQRSRTRVTLLVMQGTLSVLLLVGAGLFVRSLENVKQVRLGYDVDPILAVDVTMRGVTLDTARTVALRARLLEVAQRIPGVERAALETSLPFGGRNLMNIGIPGMDAAAFRRIRDMYVNAVSPEYFATMGTRILRGRGFGPNDAAVATGAVVVSATMARTLWPGKEALGQCVTFRKDGPCAYVVGIAEDIKNVRFSDDPGLQYYVPSAQVYRRVMGLVVRTRGDASRDAESVRQALQKEMPGASYVTVTPFANDIDQVTRSWRLGATLFVAFGALALVLAAIGLYSVVSYTVAQRIHEMGVRRALGARTGDVVRLVVRQGVLLGGIGVAIGAAVAIAGAGQVAPLLFGVSPRDPAVFAFVAVAMLLVALVASLIPAMRASRVDPNIALRSE